MASKKNIINRDNPALSFISSASAELEEPVKETPSAPAKTTTPKATKEEEATPEGYYLNPKYIEKKQRYNICFKPSFKEQADKRAEELGLSFSAYLEKLIIEDITK